MPPTGFEIAGVPSLIFTIQCWFVRKNLIGWNVSDIVYAVVPLLLFTIVRWFVGFAHVSYFMKKIEGGSVCP